MHDGGMTLALSKESLICPPSPIYSNSIITTTLYLDCWWTHAMHAWLMAWPHPLRHQRQQQQEPQPPRWRPPIDDGVRHPSW